MNAAVSSAASPKPTSYELLSGISCFHSATRSLPPPATQLLINAGLLPIEGIAFICQIRSTIDAFISMRFRRLFSFKLEVIPID